MKLDLNSMREVLRRSLAHSELILYSYISLGNTVFPLSSSSLVQSEVPQAARPYSTGKWQVRNTKELPEL